MVHRGCGSAWIPLHIEHREWEGGIGKPLRRRQDRTAKLPAVTVMLHFDEAWRSDVWRERVLMEMIGRPAWSTAMLMTEPDG